MRLLPSRLRGQSQVITVMIMVTIIMAGNGLVSPMLPIYAAQFGLSGTLIGSIVTLFAVGRLIANFPAGMLAQRFGRRPLLCGGSVGLPGTRHSMAHLHLVRI